MPLKTVLMLCYLFPPINASGVMRSLGFVAHLSACGWKPVVLTVKTARDRWVRNGAPVPEGVRIIRTYEWDLHGFVEVCQGVFSRLARVFQWETSKNYFHALFCVPDAQIAWFSTFRGIQLARQAECVYVSCSPFSSALSGCWIKRCTGKPLVVDFRDAWSLNPHTKLGHFQRKIIGLLERFVLRQCDALIVNTSGTARLYCARYPQHAHKITAIPNGYDALNLAPFTQRNSKFSIMHVGTFYGSRNPRALLEVLMEMNRPDIEFVQIGGSFEGFEEFQGKVSMRLLPSVSHEEALQLMRTADVLYLKQGWESGTTNYIAVAAKTYEYIATGLPIIADCPPGDNANLVSQYASKAYVVSEPKKEILRKTLEQALNECREHHPFVREEFQKDFDRQNLTKTLAVVFEKVSRAENAVSESVRI